MVHLGRTKATTCPVNKTFANVANVDGWLAAIAPNYLPGLSKMFLIVSKDNKVIK